MCPVVFRTLGAEGLRVVNISMISNEISYISHLYLYTRDRLERVVIDPSDKRVERRTQICISTPMHETVNLHVDIYLQHTQFVSITTLVNTLMTM